MPFTRPKAAQIDFDVTNISDPLIRLNSGQSGSNDKDVGIIVERGSDTNTAILWDESADQFVLVNTTEDGSTAGNVTIASYAGLQANAIVYGSLNDGTTTLTSTVAELNILDGVTATATELNYVDGVTSAIQTQLDAKLALAGGTMSGAIAMGTNKITGMGDPTANQDAATKAYVDTQTSSIVTTTDIAGDTGSDTVTLGSDTLTFSGTANEIATAVTDNTVTFSLPDDITIGSDLTVTGNLTVNGTTTTISTTNSVVSDSLIELNTGAASNANDLGIVMERGSTGDNAIIAWDESADAFVMGTTTATGASTGNLTIANGELRLDTLRIDQSGTGFRMTNVGAFDNDGSDNFRIFATNDLQLKANGDSGGGLSIDVTNNDVTIDNDLRVSAGQFYYGGTAVTSTAAELNILDGVTSTATELNLLDGVTGTLVTEAGTQTLTNKTLTNPTINAFSGTGNGTITGNLTVTSTVDADTYTTDGLTLVDNNIQSNRSNDNINLIPSGTGTVTINGSAFPTGFGTNGYVLTTDGAGTLTWAESSGGSSDGINHRSLDDISSGFNGSATDFTLQVSGSNVTPGSTTAVLISINGIIQEPTTTYTISGSTITFTTPPSSGATFFGIVYGTLSIGVPGDGTVSSAKLDTNIAVTGTLSSGGTLTATGAFTANGGAVFNENSADVDFRVESNTNANMLFVDAGNDRVGIANATPSTALDVTGTVTATAFAGPLTGAVTGNADTATTLATARNIAGQSFDGSGDITIASTDLSNSSAITLLTSTQTLTNKTLTSAQVTTDIRLNAQAELEFYDSDSSNYVAFKAPATIASNLTWTLPATDGNADQVLSTNGAGTLAWADGGGGGGSGSSYPNSTFTTVPGTDGDFDMSYNVAQTTQETPFEASGTDAFGVNLGSVFTFMDPVGTTESIDYGDGEAYVGA